MMMLTNMDDAGNDDTHDDDDASTGKDATLLHVSMFVPVFQSSHFSFMPLLPMLTTA